jgi:hypothetical protein
MKKVIYSLFMAGLLVNAMHAAVFTVSNDPNAPAQYSSINTALGVANPGDTVMVYGSGISYGTVNVNRTVVLIGRLSQSLWRQFHYRHPEPGRVRCLFGKQQYHYRFYR